MPDRTYGIKGAIDGGWDEWVVGAPTIAGGGGEIPRENILQTEIINDVLSNMVRLIDVLIIMIRGLEDNALRQNPNPPPILIVTSALFRGHVHV